MGSSQFNYNNNIFSGPSVGDWFSDTFLGTSNTDNKNTNALLNYQMQYNEYMQDKANQFNKEMVENANKFNEYMSSTAYQRAMKDMEQAGINPLIAFSKGASPASSPSSAALGSATASAPSATAPKQNFLNSILGKSTAKIVYAGIDKMLRRTVNSDQEMKDWLNIFAKFV